MLPARICTGWPQLRTTETRTVAWLTHRWPMYGGFKTLAPLHGAWAKRCMLQTLPDRLGTVRAALAVRNLLKDHLGPGLSANSISRLRWFPLNCDIRSGVQERS